MEISIADDAAEQSPLVVPRGSGRTKRNFSGLTLEEAMRLIPAENLSHWLLDAAPRPPSDILLANLQRLESFELTGSEAAKVMLIDTLLAEVVPTYPNLKVWKSAPLESDKMAGVADYLIAPRRAYIGVPLLCVVEAKRDDFDAGQVQCVAEMAACQYNNRQKQRMIDVFGIVSNGQVWQFYRLTNGGDISRTELYTMKFMPELLGALNHLCAECAAHTTL